MNYPAEVQFIKVASNTEEKIYPRENLIYKLSYCLNLACPTKFKNVIVVRNATEKFGHVVFERD